MYVPQFHAGEAYEGSAQRLRRNRLSISLPAFDLPELQEPADALGAALAERLEAGVDSPLVVTRARTPTWSRLLFGQACGYRYIKRLTHIVTPLATPHYRAPGAQDGYVRAAVVVRADDPAGGLNDLRGRRLGLVATDFNSANLLRAEVAALAGGTDFFSGVYAVQGSGRLAETLAEGEADAALIDGVAFAQLGRHRPRLASRLKLLAWTAKSPAAPFVMSTALVTRHGEAVRSAAADIFSDPALKPARDQLLIGAIGSVEWRQYQAALHFQHLAETLGYPNLR